MKDLPHHCDHDNIPPRKYPLLAWQMMLFTWHYNGHWIYWHDVQRFYNEQIPDYPDDNFIH